MKEILHYCCWDSPVGRLTLVASERGLVMLEFGRRGEPGWVESEGELLSYREELEQYFAGRRQEFTFPLDLRGTEFQKHCWHELLKIPYGETRSYAEIARAVGRPRAFRAVGMANNRNPVAIVVPCHRVLASDGSLCGYGGGLGLKEKLLALEKSVAARNSAA